MAEVHAGSAGRAEEWACREEVETERRQLSRTVSGEGRRGRGRRRRQGGGNCWFVCRWKGLEQITAVMGRSL